MTTIATFTAQNRVYVISDGAALGLRGKLKAVIAKQFIAPQLGAVIVGRGMNPCVTVGAFLLQKASRGYGPRGFDDLLDRAPSVLRKMSMVLRGICPAPSWRYMDLVLAGISERHGPSAFIISNHSGHGGLKAFHLVDLGRAFTIPGDQSALDQADAAMQSGRHPAEVARELLADVRREEVRTVTGITAPQAGGFIQFTTITPAGILTQCAGMWPDEVGSKVDPAAEVQR